MRRISIAAALTLVWLLGTFAPARAQQARADLSGLFSFGAPPSFLTAAPVPAGSAFITINHAAFDLTNPRSVRLASVEGFPLGSGRRVRLLLERFDVMAPTGVVVAGTAAGDVPFEPEKHLIFKGSVDGIQGSFVYLAVFQRYCVGFIDIPGPDGSNQHFGIGPDNAAAAVPTMIVYDSQLMPGAGRGHIECGAEDLPDYQQRVDEVFRKIRDSRDFKTNADTRSMQSATPLAVQIAVECDIRYFQSHASSISQSANYALVVLGASSAIYQRDAGVALQIPYLRVWTVVGPYTGPNIGDLLGQVRDYWNQNMTVQRSTTVLFSYNIGGGLAYVNVLCNNFGYAVCGLGNIINFPVDHYEWDVDVTSHELGHNFGSPHTHNCSWAPPIDSCVAPEGGCTNATNPHPGSIMSYCHLNAGTQLYLHPRVATLIRKNFELSSCVGPINGVVANDLAVVQIVTPAVGGKIVKDASFTPSAIVRNIGTLMQTDVQVTFTINSSTSGTAIYSSTRTFSSIAAGASVTVTFDPGTLSAVDIYSAKVTVAAAATDAALINNTMVRPFEVAATASKAIIKVTSPNGGETFAAGSTVPIQWTASIATNVTVQFSPDNGITWIVLHYSQPATPGTMSWVVPPMPTTQGRIRINDLDDATAVDISDGAFRITVGKDIQALDFLTPAPADTASTPATPQVLFRNNGTQPLTDVPVRLRIIWRGNNVEVYNQNATIPQIAPGAIATVTFPPTPLLPGGTHVMIARALLDGDEAPSNDSIGRTSDFFGISPPIGLKAMPMSRAVLLTWAPSASEGITSYQLYRGTTPENLVPIATLRPTVLAYADDGLTDGTPYLYALTTRIAAKQSIFSQIVSATPETYPAGFTLDAPETILPEPDKRNVPTAIDFLWHTLPGAEIYQVQIGANQAMSDVIANTFTQDLESNYTLGFNTECYWRVRAFNYSSESPWSATRHFTTGESCAGAALAFNGQDSRMVAPLFNWSDTAVTVEFWNYVRTADVKSSSAFSVGTDATSNRFQAHCPWSDRTLYWDYGDITTDGRVSADYTPYLDKWTHVALVSDGVAFKGIYLDGQLVASGDKASFPSTRTNLVVGCFLNDSYHKGKIDELRIWKRVRSEAEIQSDMLRRVTVPQPGLVGYWRFDENVGTVVADLTGNGANGALGADSLWTASSAPINCNFAPPTDAPAPIAPAAGTQFTVRLNPGLSWSSVPKATDYRLELAIDSNFNNVTHEVPDVTTPAHTVTGLRPATTYWWRVCGINSEGFGPWSSTRSFTTAGACITSAIQFDSTSALIRADSFAFKGRAVTVEFWNYVDAAAVRPASAFSVGQTDDQANRFQSHAPWSDKNLYWDYGDISTTGRISVSYAPYLNKWTHVALVSNGTDFKAIYLDGQAVATSASAGTAHDRSQLVIGGVIPSWTHSGAIGEFRVWNTARTPEAIKHDMFRRLPSPQSGLLGYWSLDEGGGAVAHDSSGFAHDGSIGIDSAWRPSPMPLDPFPVVISGPAIVHPDDLMQGYSVPTESGSHYTWSVVGGISVDPSGGAAAVVRWSADTTAGYVAVRIDREDGCADSVVLPVSIRVGAGVERTSPVAGLSFTSVPNPFSTSTQIRYDLLRRERVELSIYSLDGAIVRRLVDGMQEPGIHEVIFNGEGLPSGVYICRLGAGDEYLYVKALQLVK